MDSWAIASIPVLFFTLWVYTAFMSNTFPSLVQKRILLLIAHPDDEAMFFAPTVQALSAPSLGNQLKILCLSTGNADGLGEVRAKELQKSASLLGLDGKNDILQIDDPNFSDGPEAWNPQTIARSLVSSLAPDLAKTPNSKAPTAMIDVIITFDKYGVSSHPNHTSCYHGAVAFMGELMRGRSGWEPPVTLYTLKSVNILRKYAHVLDAIPTIMTSSLTLARQGGGKRKTKSRGSEQASLADPALMFFVSNIPAWTRAQKAMVNGHWSQMVWFRWGWIGLGRYLMINDLNKVKAH